MLEEAQVMMDLPTTYPTPAPQCVWRLSQWLRDALSYLSDVKVTDLSSLLDFKIGDFRESS